MKKYCYVAHFRSNERGIFTYRVSAVDIIAALYAFRSQLSDSFVSAYMTDLKFDDVYEYA